MPFPMIDLSHVRTYHLDQRPSLVNLETLIRPDTPPPPYANPELEEVAERIVTARRNGAPVIWMIGGHVVKRGLSLLLIELMRNHVITHLASNGAAAIHDFEIAFLGRTSEDVASSIENGNFGMAEETGAWMNQAIRAGARDGLGMGEALGRWISQDERFIYKSNSLLYNAYQLHLPYTIHVALGTDIIHQHPLCDFAASGWATGQDFRIFTHAVTTLEGGVFCNFGSAVIGPEVFLKALSISRNLGHPVRVFTTANFDLISLDKDYRSPVNDEHPEYYYRPKKNIIIRPTSLGGKGFHIVGDHTVTVPNLYHLIHQKIGENEHLASPVPPENTAQTWSDAVDLLSLEAHAASDILRSYLERYTELRPLAQTLRQAFRVLIHCFNYGGTLFLCGNGGSFADAIHIAGELEKSFKRPRPIPISHRERLKGYPGGESLADHLEMGFRTVVLGTNPALVSAVDNDKPLRHLMFAQEFYVLSRPGDILFGISTSGESENIYHASITAKSLGASVIALTGAKASRLSELADVSINAPAIATDEVQTWHRIIYHLLCEMLERHFFDSSKAE